MTSTTEDWMLKRGSLLLVVVLMLAAGPLLAQRGGMGMGMMPPGMNGLWNPVVGSGATYEVVGKDGKKMQITVAVVSKEEIDGQSGYWLETLMPGNDGQVFVMQQFMVKDAGQMSVARMIVQQPGQPPMLISGAMMGMMGRRGGATPPTPKADFREGGENLGTESITTPAGTFECIHWRGKDGANAWISPKAGPWGTVKSTSADASMTVLSVTTDAKSHVVGTPQSIESMMGGRGRGQE
jgi:hypothetical protein